MEAVLTYPTRTQVTSFTGESRVSFAADVNRGPVAFTGRLKNPLLMRQLLFSLQDVILGDFRWLGEDEFQLLLDPVITVHPDQIFMEAFSADESCYARLSAPLTELSAIGAVSYGTTNIDFTHELRDSLQRLRSSRDTMFSVGAGGFGVETRLSEGGAAEVHHERKVDVPETWIKGFLQVQAALVMPHFTFDVRPVDLLSAIAFFTENKPPKPPHGLRYEMKKDQDIKLIAEPWEQSFELQGASYGGYDRTVRVWGRQRLTLLQNVLPYADRVTVGLIGRGLPHFYICHCGAYQFTLVLSGWSKNDWSKGSAFDLLAPRARLSAVVIESVLGFLAVNHYASRAEAALALELELAEVEQALMQLCRGGRVMFDPVSQLYRLRELFPPSMHASTLAEEDPRLEAARGMVDAGQVKIESIVDPRENDRPETRAVARVRDDAEYETTVAVDIDGRLRYARCECAFFANNMMSRGPCEHILAARMALDNAAAKPGSRPRGARPRKASQPDS